MNEMDLFSFMSAVPDWLFAITALVSGATAVSAITPTKTDDKILNGAVKVLNLVAGNIGKNKNADA